MISVDMIVVYQEDRSSRNEKVEEDSALWHLVRARKRA